LGPIFPPGQGFQLFHFLKDFAFAFALADSYLFFQGFMSFPNAIQMSSKITAAEASFGCATGACLAFSDGWCDVRLRFSLSVFPGPFRESCRLLS